MRESLGTSKQHVKLKQATELRLSSLPIQPPQVPKR